MNKTWAARIEVSHVQMSDRRDRSGATKEKGSRSGATKEQGQSPDTSPWTCCDRGTRKCSLKKKMSDQNGVQMCKNLLAVVEKNEKKIARLNQLIETVSF